jgi:hypothetical protein
MNWNIYQLDGISIRLPAQQAKAVESNGWRDTSAENKVLVRMGSKETSVE